MTEAIEAAWRAYHGLDWENVNSGFHREQDIRMGRAIAAYEAAKPTTGWQPIESAPKDRWILLFRRVRNIISYESFYVGYYDDNMGWVDTSERSIDPIYWMDLPPPPPEDE